MVLDIFTFILGFICLVKGADIMVEGSSSIAKRFGVSSFFIGLTVVAFGTSAPELVVSMLASIKGSSGIALGNIIGSNISNSLLILGVSSIIAPLLVKKTTVNKEIPFSLLSILAVSFLVNDYLIDKNPENGLTRIDGLILILFFSIFIYYTFGITREKDSLVEETIDKLKPREKDYSAATASGKIIVGLAGLVLGGHWIVGGAMEFAYVFGVSEALIGLTIVAIGTSLPELATSAVAAYRGKTDIAVGNVIGSNIFNLLWVLGVSAVIQPIPFETALNIDFSILIILTILLLFLIYFGKREVLDRKEGIILVLLYVGYVIFLILRG